MSCLIYIPATLCSQRWGRGSERQPSPGHHAHCPCCARLLETRPRALQESGPGRSECESKTHTHTHMCKHTHRCPWACTCRAHTCLSVQTAPSQVAAPSPHPPTRKPPQQSELLRTREPWPGGPGLSLFPWCLPQRMGPPWAPVSLLTKARIDLVHSTRKQNIHRQYRNNSIIKSVGSAVWILAGPRISSVTWQLWFLCASVSSLSNGTVMAPDSRVVDNYEVSTSTVGAR